ncbi:unnamed protein product [Amoebophrya sp. A120]|nr:unnamed protein product [Amoebophrya sp. A120]|eukprot:GSA120T00021684001.1
MYEKSSASALTLSIFALNLPCVRSVSPDPFFGLFLLFLHDTMEYWRFSIRDLYFLYSVSQMRLQICQSGPPSMMVHLMFLHDKLEIDYGRLRSYVVIDKLRSAIIVVLLVLCQSRGMLGCSGPCIVHPSDPAPPRALVAQSVKHDKLEIMALQHQKFVI